jgi:nucleoside diphosphate kinase
MGAGSSLAAIRQLEFEEAGAEGLSLEYPTVRSIKELVEQIERESGEPPPVPKKTQLKKIGGLMRQMGVLKTAAGVKYMEAREVELESFGFDDTENGHDMLAERIEASGPIFEKLNRGAMLPTPGTAFPIALVADQDEGDAGKDLADACSYLAYGKLVYNGAAGAASYSIDLPGEQPIRTAKGDSAGRGVEYSALEVFANRMITADDRTGALDEIVKCGDRFNFRVQPLVNAAGDELSIKTGDGSTDEPLACEWSTQKQGKMLVGSTGIERPDGNEGDMWIVSIDANTLEIMQHDWRPMYRSLRNAAGCAHPNGYMVHEGCRWSDYHCYWFFLPRQLSREPFDEEKHARKCSNLMLAVPGILPGAPPRNESGDDVIMQPYLTKQAGRGCSDFLFIPGTNDTHFFLLRTEESEDGAISTYGSVIDLEANVLMEEVKVATERKFEGAAWVGGWGPFPTMGPAASGRMLSMQNSIKLAKKATPQQAFVFIKPHACTDKVIELVKSKFAEVGVKILTEGEIDGATIDSKKLIDQHYYAIASKATIMTPDQLNVPKDKFKETFSEEWDTVLAEGRVLNALDACKKLEIDADAIDAAWGEAKAAKRIVKFGGGFYCARVELEGKDPLYTLNAFFMSMRSKFTQPDQKIHYFSVEFDASTLAWSSFRGDVLGPTDPASAPANSLRGQIMSGWQDLGLASAPNTGDNGVHASASPLEGLAEKMNWLEIDPATDGFATALLGAGVPMEMLKEWTVDPQVKLPGGDGKKGSLFDQLEDMDFPDAVAKCKAIAEANK